MTFKTDSLTTGKDKSMAVETSSVSSRTTGSSNEENTERGNWVGRLDFLLSCIGYAVGLGNIWRFPYLCYRNGGAVFLIPYLVFLALCGMPLFFLEVSYGQFASLSPITVWRISPLFKGIGYGMVIISGIVCIYYNVIVTWTLYYLFKSFSAHLPWASCNNEWNTEDCARPTTNDVINGTLGNVTNDVTNGTYSYLANGTLSLNSSYSVNESLALAVNATLRKRTPSEEYWQNHVLDISAGIEQMGDVRLELLGCLALAWVVVFLCLCKGVKSSGRVVYFTATFPYVVLFILLIRGVTLPGALSGIKFYVIPKWEKLLEIRVWFEAAMQIFYSVGAAWGALITMASYNRFHHDCYRDAKIVPLLNCATSIFAGFVIFSIIGFMAHETGSSIEEVVTQGPGLVFVVYPEAVARMPISPLWAVLFFLMLFTIGLDSQFGMFETMTSACIDEFPILRNKKLLVTAALCVLEFILGIPCITKGGIYFLQIMDWYSSTFSLMILSCTECLVLCWIYGAERLYKDIELMIGYRPCIWWKICWCFITPILIVILLLFSFIMHSPVTYGTYTYPGWAIGLGWIFALCSIVPLPIVAIVKIAGETGSFAQRIRKLVKPSDEWGPALEHHRQMYLASVRGLEAGAALEEVTSLQPAETVMVPMAKVMEEEDVVDLQESNPDSSV